ncbi:hypothetical protein [Micrococcus terreus]|uniref:hypothetical protein n=1 Tax=Micrococcus terreus TaxID=574650 RepID=UPI0023F971BD|nr:hypothetical protein [Micrococcus terreus]
MFAQHGEENLSAPTTVTSRRSIARGVAWAVPAVALATAAPALASSPPSTCLPLFRESSGGSSCTMGLWTNSNTGGTAGYPTTLQTKPLYDCLCGPLKYCTNNDPAAIDNVSVEFLIPTCYTISPSTSWTSDNGGTPWKASIGTSTYNGVTYQLLTVKYSSISKYQAGAQIQVPLRDNCGTADDNQAQRIYSRMLGQCTKGGATSSTPWSTISTSGTSWTN